MQTGAFFETATVFLRRENVPLACAANTNFLMSFPHVSSGNPPEKRGDGLTPAWE